MSISEPRLVSDDVPFVALALQDYMQADVLDGLWKRPQLSPRDRSIVTLSVLITRNQTLDLPFYRATTNLLRGGSFGIREMVEAGRPGYAAML